jgi:small GTP-binding protein
MIHVNVEVEPEKIANIDLQVWDLGGQDRFRFILPSYIQGADGALLLYDVKWFPSQKTLPNWMEMWLECTIPNIPIYLIGTKLDLVEPSNLSIVEQMLFELKESLRIEKAFLISSKNGSGIDNTIHSIARDMWKFKKQYSQQKHSAKKQYSLYETLRK